MSQDPVWKCEPKFENPEITVGEIYSVTCEGAQMAWKKPELEVVMPQDFKYHFHVTTFDEVTPQKIKFSAVTYKTGQYKLTDQIVITDGENKINLSPWDLKVASVIEPQNGEEPKPFGPFGPFQLEWPLWMWVALGVFVISILSTALIFIWDQQRRRKWAFWVAEYTTALSPYHQFYKDFRRLSRLSQPTPDDLSKLEESFRLYFLRELKVPTLNEPADWVLKWLRKKNPMLSKNLRPELHMVYRELARAKKTNFSPDDFEQLTRKCQQIVDRVFDGLKEGNA